MLFVKYESALPEVCYSTNKMTGDTILIKRGEIGYYLAKELFTSPDELNKIFGITKEQQHAMEVGSMFGWDTEGANPATYEGRV